MIAQNRCLAYIAVNKHSGALHQIAVHKAYRRRGYGTAVLHAAQRALGKTPLRVINIESEDQAFRAFMTRMNAKEIPGQFELAMPL